MILILFLAALSSHASDAPSPFQRDAAFFQAKCAKCHTIGRGDRVGPDLKGLAQRREKAWTMGFLTKTGWYLDNDPEARGLLERFNGVRMEDLSLSQSQAEGLLAYVESASKGPVVPEEETEPELDDPAARVRTPDEGRGAWLPGVAAGLLLLGLGAALWRLGFAAPAALLLVLASGAGYWSLGGRRHHRLLGYQQGYEPEQPIAYSHKTHAGMLKMDCLSCHFGAQRSDAAGIPPLSVCMGCHTTVRKSSGAQAPSPEIAKLVAAWETRLSSAPQPVLWNRVHDLPDFSHFSHRVHVANDIKCQECHGAVQEMSRVRQAAPLSMGWCMDCHRLKKSEAPTHWKRAGGPFDCAACHW